MIIDTNAVLKNRYMFSARGAGILGFSIFGSKRLYALNENMELNVDQVVSFLNEHQNERIFIFGFTFAFSFEPFNAPFLSLIVILVLKKDYSIY